MNQDRSQTCRLFSFTIGDGALSLGGRFTQEMTAYQVLCTLYRYGRPLIQLVPVGIVVPERPASVNSNGL
jgi:hypothetical protein